MKARERHTLYRGGVKRSGVLSAWLVLAAGLAGGACGSEAAEAPPVKNVTGWITALAMDGPQVAYATQAYAPTNCDKVFTWNVATHRGVLVSGPKTGTCGDDEPHGQPVRQVAIAGDRLAWIRNITGNTESDDYLFTATLPKPSEVKLASSMRTGDTSGILKGDWIGGLVGSGTVLAVNFWSTDASGAVTQASLTSVRPSSLSRLVKGPATITAQSADLGRIAVARPDGSVAIYSAAGTLLKSIAPSSIREIALRKDYLVALTQDKTLEIYNAHTGAFIRKWAVPGGAANLDVHSNIAVYSVDRKLYGVQLTTGKQVVLAARSRAIVAASIEAPGVVYAYNTSRGIKSIGNLIFLPLTRVKTALA
jgi:hypothetical protein